MVQRSLRILVVLVVVSPLGLSAQQPPRPPGLKTGNPTPGTPQPEPPNLAMRITLTGCVLATEDRSGRGPAAPDANSPSDSRFVLVNAERSDVVPPGTGTASAGVEPAERSADRPADPPADREYRLRAIDSQLSPFVGARVEISGEVLPSPKAGGAQTSEVVGTKNDGGSVTPDAPPEPTLEVEFVQKLAPSCS